ncbi:MAG: hypothetical protein DWQ18_05615 [Crenarchaeota archaeon]|nr:MAG: hypothetical protein DWQ17_07520 [Thermoproteota archaeon]RDJ33524.1 MAG: hypothetical protein DWQ18_05615 [Thermoproteota archaeon]RDJ38156.1 MAG: hypothetical protein DWQ19_01560 [Thermoproteota archaeon]RDJ39076.1 MAG: hypothetical protein DWQ13_02110 [Thermoproteota archaeon]
MRSFDEWVNSLPGEAKEMIPLNEKPHLNLINYLWVNNILSGKESSSIPTVEELLSWITNEKIEAKRG